ncbi:MAG: hypothetical protein IJU26_03815 [Synergistaceae bacterium]|nr:hypothetical protein [Synergistaceae bacterium]
MFDPNNIYRLKAAKPSAVFMSTWRAKNIYRHNVTKPSAVFMSTWGNKND